jgi:hypothetical protein
MPETRAYGCICPNCQHSIRIGEIEIDRIAPLSVLHDELSRGGWQDKTVGCNRPRCFGERLCTVGDTIFLAEAPLGQ